MPSPMLASLTIRLVEACSLLCYFKAFKTHVNLGFFRGSEMADPSKLLEGSGDKMRHLKIKGLNEINEELIKELIATAVKLNISGE
ncbi:MAG: DUF1801 domain-containing protein [Firmicutes bacterium]|nr:DUF1801 domain-containing protein [Bacillota bacterium]